MKKVFVSHHLFEVEMCKERLEQAEIPCTIKNQRSSSLAGEIPFTEVFPELWVLQDEDHDRAHQLLKDESELLGSNHGSWICAGCGERHEGQFSVCWKCGQDKSLS